MDEARVLARLERIDALDRSGAATGEVLAELRSLVAEAERSPSRVDAREEVVERLRTAPHGT